MKTDKNTTSDLEVQMETLVKPVFNSSKPVVKPVKTYEVTEAFKKAVDRLTEEELTDAENYDQLLDDYYNTEVIKLFLKTKEERDTAVNELELQKKPRNKGGEQLRDYLESKIVQIETGLEFIKIVMMVAYMAVPESQFIPNEAMLAEIDTLNSKRSKDSRYDYLLTLAKLMAGYKDNGRVIGLGCKTGKIMFSPKSILEEMTEAETDTISEVVLPENML